MLYFFRAVALFRYADPEFYLKKIDKILIYLHVPVYKLSDIRTETA